MEGERAMVSHRLRCSHETVCPVEGEHAMVSHRLRSRVVRLRGG